MTEEYDYSNYRVYSYPGIDIKFIDFPIIDSPVFVNYKRVKRQYNERRNKRKHC